MAKQKRGWAVIAVVGAVLALAYYFLSPMVQDTSMKELKSIWLEKGVNFETDLFVGSEKIYSLSENDLKELKARFLSFKSSALQPYAKDLADAYISTIDLILKSKEADAMIVALEDEEEGEFHEICDLIDEMQGANAKAEEVLIEANSLEEKVLAFAQNYPEKVNETKVYLLQPDTISMGENLETAEEFVAELYSMCFEEVDGTDSNE